MDLLALVARLTLDKSGYEQGLNEAESQASSTGGKLGKVLGSVGKAAGTVAKVTAAGITAGATAVGFLAKQSVGAYASYEQLSGGVKKLFGDAADDVMKFANDAYKTSGMSANKYMEQATSFSAALINALGGDTKKAAEQADVAMRAMSDNVNTFGTDMSAVQYAFNGFAKQNYTMLDNLKLGYGGTKTEMERLIADANEYAKANGQAADLSIESFSDIVTAIELIQEKQGIAGTTAKEAATTIEGSFNMTKAAWENLVAGLANPDADIGKLMDNLIVAVVGDREGTGLLNQLLPAIERALDGVGQFLERAAPIIAAYLPGLVNKIAPRLISAATTLISGLVKSLPAIIQVLIQQVPMIVSKIAQAFMETAPLLIQLGKNLMKSVYDGLTQTFPQIAPVLEGFKKVFETAFKGIEKVVDFFKKHFETIKAVVVAVGGAIAAVGLVGTIASIAGAIGTVVGAIGGLISALSMIKSFAGLVSVITTLAGGPLVLIPALIGAIVAAVIYLWNTSETFRNFVLGLWAKIQEIVAGAVAVFQNLGAAFALIWQDIVNTATAIWTTLKSVVLAGATAVKDIATRIFTAIRDFISNAWQTISTVTSNVWNSIRTAITNIISSIRTTISNVFNNISSTISTIFGNVKSKASEIWGNIREKISETVENIRSGIAEKFQAVYNKAHDIFEKVKEAITKPIDDAKETIGGIIDKISGLFSGAKFEFPHIKLPHFSWTWKDIGGIVSIPQISVDWYAKAYDNPFLLKSEELFGRYGFGDRGSYQGGELVYSHDKLMDDIRKASGGGTFAPVINVYTQEGQSNEEIAHKVMDILTFEYQRQGSVFA